MGEVIEPHHCLLHVATQVGPRQPQRLGLFGPRLHDPPGQVSPITYSTAPTRICTAATLQGAGCLSEAATELGAWLLTQPAPAAWLASAEGQAALARALTATRQRAARQGYRRCERSWPTPALTFTRRQDEAMIGCRTNIAEGSPSGCISR